jgi:histidinol-phosphate/aromatic aminotransferase/cobyric acid decarboxylase-like protein|tara:strand:+ start:7238 stop:8293 length:1056 start_codon:yes stop_codon:yes gene_type:complete
LSIIIKRVRKFSPNPKKSIRINRAEFGHDVSKDNKKDFFNFYYPNSAPLVFNIAKLHKINTNNIIVGLGAESLIKDLYIWHAKKFKTRRVGFSLPNFQVYKLNAKIWSYKIFNYFIDPVKPKLLNIEFIKNFLKKNKINLFVLINPSHPFEKNWNLKELEKIIQYCKSRKITILVDEVYQNLGSKSAYKFINKYNNLIILRSFSKSFGLPGLRVGYTMASKKISQEIETYRLAIELPQHSINVVNNLLNKSKTEIYKTSKRIIKARNYAHMQFRTRGLKSYSHFLNSVNVDMFNKINALKVGKYLRKNNIFINYTYAPPHSQFINLTTTNISNLKIFFKKFDEILIGIKFL